MTAASKKTKAKKANLVSKNTETEQVPKVANATPTHTILVITKSDLDAENFYVGSTDVSSFYGSIKISADLGCVRFRGGINATGSLIALSGSGIEAGEGIKAGWGIEAGEGIKAGWGIEAGEGIKAGWGIEAGWGIKAGLSISCKRLSAKLRIFAGLCMWRKPGKKEMQITCSHLESGDVAFGELVIVGEAV